MDSTVTPWLGAWRWRLDVVLVLAALGAAYVTGWRRLRRRDAASVPGWRLACYIGGLTALALALLSPIAALGGVLFSAHMVQHQLVTMVAAPLLLLGNPVPATMWGLPPALRRVAADLLVPSAPVRRLLGAVTFLPVAGILYVLTVWGWHWPPAYEASLRSDWIHDAQHVSFFLTGVLFWWPVIEPAPHGRRYRGAVRYGLAIGYLIFATAQNTLLGALISLTERTLYPSYAAGPRVFGFTAQDDQALAGGIMWSGGHMYLIAILVLLYHALDRESPGPRPGPRPDGPDPQPALNDEGSPQHVGR